LQRVGKGGYSGFLKQKGAFREDRYHATAVENGDHLLKCIVYPDFKMVRTVLLIIPLNGLRIVWKTAIIFVMINGPGALPQVAKVLLEL